MSKEWNEEDWDRIPKFILGSDCHEALVGASQWGDSEYVVHLHSPRFVGEVLHDDEGTTIKPHWIDEPEADAMSIAQLMREVGDWYSLVTSPEEGDEPEANKPEKREYVVKLTDEEIEALKKSHVNGPLYHLVKQILDQHE